MKAALFIVLSLSAMAFAGPAFNKNNNQINTNQQQQQQHVGAEATGPAVDILKQWCFSSQMSQQELTASFKKLVGVVKSQPADQATQAAVMNERICQGAMVQKSAQSGQTVGQTQADTQAHELIKDVYMDALISCKSRDCSQQLGKIINSNMVDTIRASYYLTRIAVTEKSDIKDEAEIKQMADSFVQQSQQDTASDSIERQKLFATTALIGKWIQANPSSSATIKPIVEQVVKTIAERYIKPVSEQEVQQYQQQQQQQQQVSQQLVKKIAKRNAALKAMANIPGHVLKQCSGVDQMLISLIKNKQELNTVRQSAIECLKQNDQATEMLKQVALDQSEPIEVRVAAYRALMTSAYAGEQRDESSKEQVASEILDQIVKHCEQERNQQQDEQFCLYVISHLDNLRTSQQPEHQAIKQCILKNKQHYMQIQVLSKKFKQQLNDVRHSSRNYKLEQEFNQLESGLVLEGDLIYESKNKQQQQQQQINVLPKVIRVNMSMPVMGETVNVLEVTMRQNNMDEEILGAVKLIDGAKSFASGSVSKVVDSFKWSVEKQQQQQQQQQTGNKQQQQQVSEADLTIKIDGCTVVYLCAEDFKTTTTATGNYQQQQQHQRNVRSVGYTSGSIVDDVIEYLKRQPVAFNRGFNFNFNERLAKVLDVEANMIAGLRFESHASGSSKDNFEIVAQMEPRFNFEAIVGPAKVSSKKLLQRIATKTAIGARLRFKRDELVDIQLDLPMQTMELFTVESQFVESSSSSSYKYLPDSIYGQEDIYSSYPNEYTDNTNNKLVKRSIFDNNNKKSTLGKIFSTGSGSSSSYFARSIETPEEVARATGLRGKLRVAASPKDASFIMSAVVDKYEPSMQGYRVQVQKAGRTGATNSNKQFIVTVSTPGSRLDRTMQIRLAEQSGQQRTSIKAEIESAKLSATIITELIHDGRQYGAKTEIVSRQSRAQWRHSAEAGVVIQGAASGRIASSYKPYVSIESSALKRPIQLQGTISYQQTPKTVISYELKCQTSGDFFQGKLIVDQTRQSGSQQGYQMRKRSSTTSRRSMQSPIEIVLSKDLTLTNELLAQVQEHAFKVHNMIDWDASKWSVQGDFSASHKNLRKQQQQPTILSASMKFDTEQQSVSVECKHPAQQERKDFRFNVASQMRGTSGHQMSAELRYNGRQQSVVAYKHQLEVKTTGSSKYDCSGQVELVASEYQLNEKMQGRVRLSNERRQKSLDCELSGGQNKQAKLSVDYVSLAEHQVQLVVKTERLSHKCEVRADKRQFYVQSRTDYDNQMVARKVLELTKVSPMECKLVIELPTERTHFAIDLKLAPGKLSSVAIQTPRYVSKGEFSFETVAQSARLPRYLGGSMLKPFAGNNLRLKTNLKDLMKKEAYWMDSAVNVADWNKRPSYLRLDSPVYRTDLEFDPREFSAKFGAFARSKRSIDAYESPYSTKESAIVSLIANQLASNGQRLNLDSGKLWVLRSIISSPSTMDSIKKQAKRALFEYADRRQSQRHSFDWSPQDDRLNFQLEHQPTSGRSSFASEPMRMTGDLSTNWSRPSRLALESEWMSADIDAKPFDGSESYAKIGALSRHRRSPFKKHDSEYRYNKKDGHKAWMKHQDSDDERHELQFEADAKSPKNYAKLAYEADKHGKTSYEHQWRKHSSKRSTDQKQVYNNKIAFERQPADNKHTSNNNNKWAHKSAFEWEEPIEMISRRYRRDVTDVTDFYLGSAASKYAPSAMLRRYAPVEYLKHTSARLNSESSFQPTGVKYNVDFDYQPEANLASLKVNMPDDLVHASSVEMKPSERLVKLQSRLYNSRTQEPSYEFAYATKSQLPSGLASANQEPVFVHSEHPMLERPISNSLAANLFKQPMKLDYSDKFGRVASFDYDHSPISMSGASKYENMRQKRAAIYYKDSEADFEHQSSLDFYPETFLGKLKPAYARQSGDVALKASTKYGPIVLRTDSTDNAVEMELQSPVVTAKLTGEISSSSSHRNAIKLVKLYVDNKSQRVELAKLVRQVPVDMVRKSELIKKLARKMDSTRFEHQTELLVSIVDSILKIKSQTHANQRPVLVIEAEINKQQDKAFAKINGERVRGQLVADLVNQSAELLLDIDDKRTLEHYARVSRTADNFYLLQSMASYKSKPVFKMSGKISAMVVEEPEHLFTSGCRASGNEHLSTFEGIVYEPTEYHVSGQYDCYNKEARVVFKNVDENKVQETVVKFDEQTGDIYVDARLASPNGNQSYTSKAKINVPSLFGDDTQCHHYQQQQHHQRSIGGRKPMIASNYGAGNSCRSELIYSDKSGNYAAKYVPSEYFSVMTPNGKQTYNLSSF